MRILSIQIVVCQLITLVGAGCVGSTHEFHEPGMQVYREEVILRYLRQYGFDGDSVNCRQDATGRKLTFFGRGADVWSLSADDGEPIRSQLPPQLPRLPAYAYSLATTWANVDQQSDVFFQVTPEDHVIHVGRLNGDRWLFRARETPDFTVSQICARGDTIYLLDHRDLVSPSFLHTGINCWVFAPTAEDPSRYEKVDEFSVPGEVYRVDPFSPRFICNGYGRMPFVGPAFLFDTRAHRKIRDLPWDAVVLFLDGDWLGAKLRLAETEAQVPRN